MVGSAPSIIPLIFNTDVITAATKHAKIYRVIFNAVFDDLHLEHRPSEEIEHPQCLQV